MTTKLANLTADLTSDNVAKRTAAAEALCQLGDEARAAAVALVNAVGDEEEEVCEAVTATLEGLGPPEQAHVDELSSLLTHSNADVRYWAATLLGRLEGGAATATETLAKALSSDAALHVQQRAAWALGKIGVLASGGLKALEAATASNDSRLARLASEAIKAIRGG